MDIGMKFSLSIIEHKKSSESAARLLNVFRLAVQAKWVVNAVAWLGKPTRAVICHVKVIL